MTKKIILYTLLLLLSDVSYCQKSITLEDIWKTRTFSAKSVSGFVPLSDGTSYARKTGNKSTGIHIIRYAYATGEALDTLISTSKIERVNGLTEFPMSDFHLNHNETKAIVETETEAIYRHSSASKCFVLDLKSAKITPVFKEKVMYCQFDPTSTYLSYVYENNLYIMDLTSGKTRAVTKDGKRNAIINGAVDWVYEEEFSMSVGYQWNENGTALAYYRFDESKVEEFSMTVYDGLYPKVQTFKYPKAGENNSVVDVYVYQLKGGKSVKMETGSFNDQYLPRIQWTKNNQVLSVQRLNRLQNTWELLMADALTGKTKVAFTESDKYYIDINDNLIFLPGNEMMLLTSERSGYNHIYLHKVEGPEIAPVTKGNWDVVSIIGYNEKNQEVYYLSQENTPIEKHVCKIRIDGTGKIDLVAESGNHSASFSKDYSYFLHQYSTINQPPVITIRDKDSKIVRVLEDNKELVSRLKEFNFSSAEFGTLPSDNVQLNYYMIKPAQFDPQKKYPLLMFVYGGPGSQQVINGWGGDNFAWHQMLSNQKGYIIVCVDNRGTGGRGSEFKKMTYRQLGKYESDDQINAARYFGNQSYIDAGRIGIWGWSYGGFMSSTCLMKGADVFKTAIAVAPVTNWRYYDNIYTERYMQLPNLNPTGYDLNSPINMVDRLKGKLLLVHGTADDNVHFQNTAEMVKKLVQENKPFQSAYYPDKNHGIYGGNTRLHLFTLMTNFIVENL